MEPLDKEQQFERLYATPPVYEWELIVNPISFRTQMTYFFLLFSILLSVIFFLTDSGAFSVVPILGAAFLCPWFRYLVNADKRHYYAINQYGMYSTEEQIIPEIAYTIVRRSAWVGCAICVFAAIFIGPMAFVGAGGAALMSFTMTNFRSVPHKSQCLFDGYAKLDHIDGIVYELCTTNYHYGFDLMIPESKLTSIIDVIKQYNDTFEEEFIDLYKDSKFHARPIIQEIVR
ncbi:hypothetical protein [Photobacterium iliopiscarium]|uniref:Uncharacterized protein n=1 Tax=Photobacterium iliopiscarium TaxID=56192 RepID=A0ABX5GN02_9GAMM|nr:hypothetical protein [Photobacterium iliopiscarium]PSW92453.1 hypothetical protein C9J52_18160 [Photobacterium iliopiscarium]